MKMAVPTKFWIVCLLAALTALAVVQAGRRRHCRGHTTAIWQLEGHLLNLNASKLNVWHNSATLCEFEYDLNFTGMTPEEMAKDIAWARWEARQTDGCESLFCLGIIDAFKAHVVSAGGIKIPQKLYPIMDLCALGILAGSGFHPMVAFVLTTNMLYASSAASAEYTMGELMEETAVQENGPPSNLDNVIWTVVVLLNVCIITLSALVGGTVDTCMYFAVYATFSFLSGWLSVEAHPTTAKYGGTTTTADKTTSSFNTASTIEHELVVSTQEPPHAENIRVCGPGKWFWLPEGISVSWIVHELYTSYLGSFATLLSERCPEVLGTALCPSDNTEEKIHSLYRCVWRSGYFKMQTMFQYCDGGVVCEYAKRQVTAADHQKLKAIFPNVTFDIGETYFSSFLRMCGKFSLAPMYVGAVANASFSDVEVSFLVNCPYGGDTMDREVAHCLVGNNCTMPTREQSCVDQLSATSGRGWYGGQICALAQSWPTWGYVKQLCESHIVVKHHTWKFTPEMLYSVERRITPEEHVYKIAVDPDVKKFAPNLSGDISYWNTLFDGCMIFQEVPWGTPVDVLVVASEVGLCSANLGWKKDSHQTISLANDCYVAYQTFVHEAFHLIGRGHEQQRPDRDEYVVINWQAVPKGWEHNFEMAKYVSADQSLPYEFNSTMHYYFGKWIVPIGGPVAQSTHITALDIAKAKKLLGCPYVPEVQNDTGSGVAHHRRGKMLGDQPEQPVGDNKGIVSDKNGNFFLEGLFDQECACFKGGAGLNLEKSVFGVESNGSYSWMCSSRCERSPCTCNRAITQKKGDCWQLAANIVSQTAVVFFEYVDRDVAALKTNEFIVIFTDPQATCGGYNYDGSALRGTQHTFIHDRVTKCKHHLPSGSHRILKGFEQNGIPVYVVSNVVCDNRENLDLNHTGDLSPSCFDFKVAKKCNGARHVENYSMWTGTRNLLIKIGIAASLGVFNMWLGIAVGIGMLAQSTMALSENTHCVGHIPEVIGHVSSESGVLKSSSGYTLLVPGQCLRLKGTNGTLAEFIISDAYINLGTRPIGGVPTRVNSAVRMNFHCKDGQQHLSNRESYGIPECSYFHYVLEKRWSVGVSDSVYPCGLIGSIDVGFAMYVPCNAHPNDYAYFFEIDGANSAPTVEWAFSGHGGWHKSGTHDFQGGEPLVIHNGDEKFQLDFIRAPFDTVKVVARTNDDWFICASGLPERWLNPRPSQNSSWMSDEAVDPRWHFTGKSGFKVDYRENFFESYALPYCKDADKMLTKHRLLLETSGIGFNRTLSARIVPWYVAVSTSYQAPEELVHTSNRCAGKVQIGHITASDGTGMTLASLTVVVSEVEGDGTISFFSTGCQSLGPSVFKLNNGEFDLTLRCGIWKKSELSVSICGNTTVIAFTHGGGDFTWATKVVYATISGGLTFGAWDKVVSTLSDAGSTAKSTVGSLWSAMGGLGRVLSFIWHHILELVLLGVGLFLCLMGMVTLGAVLSAIAAVIMLVEGLSAATVDPKCEDYEYMIAARLLLGVCVFFLTGRTWPFALAVSFVLFDLVYWSQWPFYCTYQVMEEGYQNALTLFFGILTIGTILLYKYDVLTRLQMPFFYIQSRMDIGAISYCVTRFVLQGVATSFRFRACVSWLSSWAGALLMSMSGGIALTFFGGDIAVVVGATWVFFVIGWLLLRPSIQVRHHERYIRQVVDEQSTDEITMEGSQYWWLNADEKKKKRVSWGETNVVEYETHKEWDGVFCDIIESGYADEDIDDMLSAFQKALDSSYAGVLKRDNRPFSTSVEDPMAEINRLVRKEEALLPECKTMPSVPRISKGQGTIVKDGFQLVSRKPLWKRAMLNGACRFYYALERLPTGYRTWCYDSCKNKMKRYGSFHVEKGNNSGWKFHRGDTVSSKPLDLYKVRPSSWYSPRGEVGLSWRKVRVGKQLFDSCDVVAHPGDCGSVFLDAFGRVTQTFSGGFSKSKAEGGVYTLLWNPVKRSFSYRVKRETKERMRESVKMEKPLESESITVRREEEYVAREEQILFEVDQATFKKKRCFAVHPDDEEIVQWWEARSDKKSMPLREQWFVTSKYSKVNRRWLARVHPNLRLPTVRHSAPKRVKTMHQYRKAKRAQKAKLLIEKLIKEFQRQNGKLGGISNPPEDEQSSDGAPTGESQSKGNTDGQVGTLPPANKGSLEDGKAFEIAPAHKQASVDYYEKNRNFTEASVKSLGISFCVGDKPETEFERHCRLASTAALREYGKDPLFFASIGQELYNSLIRSKEEWAIKNTNLLKPSLERKSREERKNKAPPGIAGKAGSLLQKFAGETEPNTGTKPKPQRMQTPARQPVRSDKTPTRQQVRAPSLGSRVGDRSNGRKQQIDIPAKADKKRVPIPAVEEYCKKASRDDLVAYYSGVPVDDTTCGWYKNWKCAIVNRGNEDVKRSIDAVIKPVPEGPLGERWNDILSLAICVAPESEPLKARIYKMSCDDYARLHKNYHKRHYDSTISPWLIVLLISNLGENAATKCGISKQQVEDAIKASKDWKNRKVSVATGEGGEKILQTVRVNSRTRSASRGRAQSQVALKPRVEEEFVRRYTVNGVVYTDADKLSIRHTDKKGPKDGKDFFPSKKEVKPNPRLTEAQSFGGVAFEPAYSCSFKGQKYLKYYQIGDGENPVKPGWSGVPLYNRPISAVGTVKTKDGIRNAVYVCLGAPVAPKEQADWLPVEEMVWVSERRAAGLNLGGVSDSSEEKSVSQKKNTGARKKRGIRKTPSRFARVEESIPTFRDRAGTKYMMPHFFSKDFLGPDVQHDGTPGVLDMSVGGRFNNVEMHVSGKLLHNPKTKTWWVLYKVTENISWYDLTRVCAGTCGENPLMDRPFSGLWRDNCDSFYACFSIYEEDLWELEAHKIEIGCVEYFCSPPESDGEGEPEMIKQIKTLAFGNDKIHEYENVEEIPTLQYSDDEDASGDSDSEEYVGENKMPIADELLIEMVRTISLFSVSEDAVMHTFDVRVGYIDTVLSAFPFHKYVEGEKMEMWWEEVLQAARSNGLASLGHHHFGIQGIDWSGVYCTPLQRWYSENEVALREFVPVGLHFDQDAKACAIAAVVFVLIHGNRTQLEVARDDKFKLSEDVFKVSEASQDEQIIRQKEAENVERIIKANEDFITPVAMNYSSLDRVRASLGVLKTVPGDPTLWTPDLCGLVPISMGLSSFWGFISEGALVTVYHGTRGKNLVMPVGNVFMEYPPVLADPEKDIIVYGSAEGARKIFHEVSDSSICYSFDPTSNSKRYFKKISYMLGAVGNTTAKNGAHRTGYLPIKSPDEPSYVREAYFGGHSGLPIFNLQTSQIVGMISSGFHVGSKDIQESAILLANCVEKGQTIVGVTTQMPSSVVCNFDSDVNQIGHCFKSKKKQEEKTVIARLGAGKSSKLPLEVYRRIKDIKKGSPSPQVNILILNPIRRSCESLMSHLTREGWYDEEVLKLIMGGSVLPDLGQNTDNVWYMTYGRFLASYEILNKKHWDVVFLDEVHTEVTDPDVYAVLKQRGNINCKVVVKMTATDHDATDALTEFPSNWTNFPINIVQGEMIDDRVPAGQKLIAAWNRTKYTIPKSSWDQMVQEAGVCLVYVWGIAQATALRMAFEKENKNIRVTTCTSETDGVAFNNFIANNSGLRVVFCTDSVENGVTIPDVRTVIHLGVTMKPQELLNFSGKAYTCGLLMTTSMKSSILQAMGRCGRQRPGTFIHFQDSLENYSTREEAKNVLCYTEACAIPSMVYMAGNKFDRNEFLENLIEYHDRKDVLRLLNCFSKETWNKTWRWSSVPMFYAMQNKYDSSTAEKLFRDAEKSGMTDRNSCMAHFPPELLVRDMVEEEHYLVEHFNDPREIAKKQAKNPVGVGPEESSVRVEKACSIGLAGAILGLATASTAATLGCVAAAYVRRNAQPLVEHILYVPSWPSLTSHKCSNFLDTRAVVFGSSTWLGRKMLGRPDIIKRTNWRLMSINAADNIARYTLEKIGTTLQEEDLTESESLVVRSEGSPPPEPVMTFMQRVGSKTSRLWNWIRIKKKCDEKTGMSESTADKGSSASLDLIEVVTYIVRAFTEGTQNSITVKQWLIATIGPLASATVGLLWSHLCNALSPIGAGIVMIGIIMFALGAQSIPSIAAMVGTAGVAYLITAGMESNRDKVRGTIRKAPGISMLISGGVALWAKFLISQIPGADVAGMLVGTAIANDVAVSATTASGTGVLTGSGAAHSVLNWLGFDGWQEVYAGQFASSAGSGASIALNLLRISQKMVTGGTDAFTTCLSTIADVMAGGWTAIIVGVLTFIFYKTVMSLGKKKAFAEHRINSFLCRNDTIFGKLREYVSDRPMEEVVKYIAATICVVVNPMRLVTGGLYTLMSFLISRDFDFQESVLRGVSMPPLVAIIALIASGIKYARGVISDEETCSGNAFGEILEPMLKYIPKGVIGGFLIVKGLLVHLVEIGAHQLWRIIKESFCWCWEKIKSAIPDSVPWKRSTTELMCDGNPLWVLFWAVIFSFTTARIVSTVMRFLKWDIPEVWVGGKPYTGTESVYTPTKVSLSDQGVCGYFVRNDILNHRAKTTAQVAGCDISSDKYDLVLKRRLGYDRVFKFKYYKKGVKVCEKGKPVASVILDEQGEATMARILVINPSDEMLCKVLFWRYGADCALQKEEVRKDIVNGVIMIRRTWFRRGATISHECGIYHNSDGSVFVVAPKGSGLEKVDQIVVSNNRLYRNTCKQDDQLLTWGTTSEWPTLEIGLEPENYHNWKHTSWPRGMLPFGYAPQEGKERLLGSVYRGVQGWDLQDEIGKHAVEDLSHDLIVSKGLPSVLSAKEQRSFNERDPGTLKWNITKTLEETGHWSLVVNASWTTKGSEKVAKVCKDFRTSRPYHHLLLEGRTLSVESVDCLQDVKKKSLLARVSSCLLREHLGQTVVTGEPEPSLEGIGIVFRKRSAISQLAEIGRQAAVFTRSGVSKVIDSVEEKVSEALAKTNEDKVSNTRSVEPVAEALETAHIKVRLTSEHELWKQKQYMWGKLLDENYPILSRDKREEVASTLGMCFSGYVCPGEKRWISRGPMWFDKLVRTALVRAGVKYKYGIVGLELREVPTLRVSCGNECLAIEVDFAGKVETVLSCESALRMSPRFVANSKTRVVVFTGLGPFVTDLSTAASRRIKWCMAFAAEDRFAEQANKQNEEYEAENIKVLGEPEAESSGSLMRQGGEQVIVSPSDSSVINLLDADDQSEHDTLYVRSRGETASAGESVPLLALGSSDSEGDFDHSENLELIKEEGTSWKERFQWVKDKVLGKNQYGVRYERFSAGGIFSFGAEAKVESRDVADHIERKYGFKKIAPWCVHVAPVTPAGLENVGWYSAEHGNMVETSGVYYDDVVALRRALMTVPRTIFERNARAGTYQLPRKANELSVGYFKMKQLLLDYPNLDLTAVYDSTCGSGGFLQAINHSVSGKLLVGSTKRTVMPSASPESFVQNGNTIQLFTVPGTSDSLGNETFQKKLQESYPDKFTLCIWDAGESMNDPLKENSWLLFEKRMEAIFYLASMVRTGGCMIVKMKGLWFTAPYVETLCRHFGRASAWFCPTRRANSQEWYLVLSRKKTELAAAGSYRAFVLSVQHAIVRTMWEGYNNTMKEYPPLGKFDCPHPTGPEAIVDKVGGIAALRGPRGYQGWEEACWKGTVLKSYGAEQWEWIRDHPKMRGRVLPIGDQLKYQRKICSLKQNRKTAQDRVHYNGTIKKYVTAATSWNIGSSIVGIASRQPKVIKEAVEGRLDQPITDIAIADLELLDKAYKHVLRGVEDDSIDIMPYNKTGTQVNRKGALGMLDDPSEGKNLGERFDNPLIAERVAQLVEGWCQGIPGPHYVTMMEKYEKKDRKCVEDSYLVDGMSSAKEELGPDQLYNTKRWILRQNDDWSKRNTQLFEKSFFLAPRLIRYLNADVRLAENVLYGNMINMYQKHELFRESFAGETWTSCGERIHREFEQMEQLHGAGNVLCLEGDFSKCDHHQNKQDAAVEAHNLARKFKPQWKNAVITNCSMKSEVTQITDFGVYVTNGQRLSGEKLTSCGNTAKVTSYLYACASRILAKGFEYISENCRIGTDGDDWFLIGKASDVLLLMRTMHIAMRAFGHELRAGTNEGVLCHSNIESLSFRSHRYLRNGSFTCPWRSLSLILAKMTLTVKAAGYIKDHPDHTLVTASTAMSYLLMYPASVVVRHISLGVLSETGLPDGVFEQVKKKMMYKMGRWDHQTLLGAIESVWGVTDLGEIPFLPPNVEGKELDTLSRNILFVSRRVRANIRNHVTTAICNLLIKIEHNKQIVGLCPRLWAQYSIAVKKTTPTDRLGSLFF